MKHVSVMVGALILVLAGCSSSGTVGSSGGTGGSGGVGTTGGSGGGATKLDGVDISGLSQEEIAGVTVSSTCQTITSVVTLGEKAISDAFPDASLTLTEYTTTAGALSDVAAGAVGPVRIMALDAEVDLRTAVAVGKAHPGQLPTSPKDTLRKLKTACQKKLANGVKGSQLTVCAYLEHQFADADSQIAEDVADSAKASGDARAAAKAISSVKEQADKADSTANLQAVVGGASDAYGGLDVGNGETLLQFDNQHENLATFCDGNVKLF